VVRDLLAGEPDTVDIIFDRNGSYANTYVQQGVDQAFATGMMGWELTDGVFLEALASAAARGTVFRFHVEELAHADHPNYVLIRAKGADDVALTVEAKSIGGGTFVITRVNGHPVRLDGKSHVLLAECSPGSSAALQDIITGGHRAARLETIGTAPGKVLIAASSAEEVPAGLSAKLRACGRAASVRHVRPVYRVKRGEALFVSAEEMLFWAEKRGCSLGEAALHYEKTLLGISGEEALAEMLRRWEIMRQSVHDGFDDEKADMLLLAPSAGRIRRGIDNRLVAVGGIHARAAAAAMAAMHTSNSRGVVCAAPTGGAAGAIPGTLTALEEAFGVDRSKMALMLFAAGGIGLILAIRGTFAAEVAGCQVEIGAAGAMASAAVVEFAGGSARQACDAAAISFQNTMGSVCDLVQGVCELPCHTRNAAAASGAFTNADLILGGYVNPIPLDETIDAVYASGLLLPGELRCTARGGLALAPSARNMIRRR